eukprot:TRINITY_DN1423_c0_g1_i4.p1 TRINITY_DN1423_c0_g1~~TRINITY_DN1423_c0_g1_i4.p1  ORF type:complete len:376 (-),score=70.98 TRINITY_DN1423_c0_g1_i4:54-1115(-)
MMRLVSKVVLLCATASAAPASTPSVTLRNGVKMPVVSAGTWLYDEKTAEASVMAAIAAGFRHIDTAFDYHNQGGVAAGIEKSGIARDNIFITTKIPGCGLQSVSAVSEDQCFKDTAARIQDDLTFLDSSYIDLMLVHFPPCAGGDGSAQSPPKAGKCFENKTGCSDPRSCGLVQAQWRAVHQAYSDGHIRAIGVSNYCQMCLKCLEKMVSHNFTMPMVNQVQYHLGMGPDPQGFKSFAQERGIALQAWSPLGSGGSGDDDILHGDLTGTIGANHKKSNVQVALKWIIANNVSVATKSSNPVHLKENLDVFDFEFSDGEMQALNSADFNKKDTPSFLCLDDPTPPFVEEREVFF